MNRRQICGKVHKGMKVQRDQGRSDWQTQEANGQVRDIRDIRERVFRGVGRSEGRYMAYADVVPSIH